MKSFIISSLLIFLFVFPAFGYQKDQINDCIKNAISNPATKSISKDSIVKYCDCALIAIIDEKKAIKKRMSS